MSMPSRRSSLPASALQVSPIASMPGSTRSGVSREVFPPPPKSVRMWVVSEMPEAGQSASAAQAARAGTGPVRSWRVIFAVFAALLAVSALVAIVRLAQEQLGN